MDNGGTWLGLALAAFVASAGVTYGVLHIADPFSWIIPVALFIAVMIVGFRHLSGNGGG